jgi:hypothetical protein
MMKNKKKEQPTQKIAPSKLLKKQCKVNQIQLHNKFFSNNNRRFDYGKSN